MCTIYMVDSNNLPIELNFFPQCSNEPFSRKTSTLTDVYENSNFSQLFSLQRKLLGLANEITCTLRYIMDFKCSRLPSRDPNNTGVSGWLSATRPVVAVIDFSLVSSRMSASYQPGSDPSCSIKSFCSSPSRYLILALFPPEAKDFLCLLCDLVRSLSRHRCFNVHLLFPEETCKEFSGGVARV